MAHGSKGKATSNTPSMPDARYNGDGKIINWSCERPDATDLDILEEHGCLDGMTPSQIQEKHPQFCKYTCKSIGSALSNMQIKHNKEIRERGEHGVYNGMRAQMAHIDKDDDLLDDEDDSTYRLENDLMSRATLRDSNEKSVRFGLSVVSRRGGASGSRSNKSGGHRSGSGILCNSLQVGPQASCKKSVADIRTSIALPYVMDVWHYKNLCKRVSIQLVLLSGIKPQKNISMRMSTSKTQLVISLPLHVNLTTPEAACNSHVLNTKANKEDMTGTQKKVKSDLLDTHPKTIARRHMIKMLADSDDATKSIIGDQQIPLPFHVQNCFVKKEEDPDFYGVQTFCHCDKSIHMHIELIGEKSMHHMMKSDDDASVKSTAHMPLLNFGILLEIISSSEENPIAPAEGMADSMPCASGWGEEEDLDISSRKSKKRTSAASAGSGAVVAAPLPTNPANTAARNAA